MLWTSLAGLRAHKLRLLLTMLAVTLGVGFIAGTFVLTDTMQRGIDADLARSAEKIDLAVLPKKGASPDEVPAALLTRIRKLPGVAQADGLVRGDAPLVGKDGKVYGSLPPVGLSLPTGDLRRYEITEGAAPSGPSQVVLDERTATKNDFKVGSSLTILDTAGRPHRFTLAGLADFGVDQDISFRGAIGFTAPAATAITGEQNFAEIDILASSNPTTLRTAVRQTIATYTATPPPSAQQSPGPQSPGPQSPGPPSSGPRSPGAPSSGSQSSGSQSSGSQGSGSQGSGSSTGGSSTAGAHGLGSLDVLTGRQLGDRIAAESGTDLTLARIGLLIFGLVAVLVAALVINNTFTILVAQRMRELALLRCVGATRRQVFGGVLLESAVVGLLGSLAGLAVGLGLSAGGLAGLNALDPTLPAGSLTLAPRTVVVGLAVGLLVTVLSALLPARSATRVAPVAALRAEQEPGSRRFRLGWARLAVTVLFGFAGVGAGLYGTFVMDKGQAALLAVALSGGLAFIAVNAAMPALIRPLSRLVGAVPGRIGGVPGQLAVENARRAPRRTATTTLALTIGVGLMSLFAVVAASGKASVDRRLAEEFPVDFQLYTQHVEDEPLRIPRALVSSLRASPEFTAVTEVWRRDAKLAGDSEEVGSVTQAALTGGLVKPEIRSGDLADLTSGTVAVQEDIARKRGLKVGDTVPLQTSNGTVPVKVTVVLGGGIPLPVVLVPQADYAAYFPNEDPRVLYLNVRDGVPATVAEPIVEKAAEPYPAVRIDSAAGLKEDLNRSVDQMLMIFAALLGLSIVIALFGIANTLTLSVVERTRESALLRALGITKRQLRRMLAVEAVIMAAIGALTGVTLGITWGWAVTHAMVTRSVFALPYTQIAIFITLAALAGAAAALLPARRATRPPIAQSLSHD